MQTLGKRFAGALHRFLPLILSPWFIFGGSGVSLSEVLSAAKGQLPDTIGIRDVADFVVATREGGANLIGLLHSLGYTRGLLEALGFAESRRLSIMLKYAMLGDTPEPPATPPMLTLRQQLGVRWRVTVMGSHIQLLKPLVWPLQRYANAQTAPPVWLLASLPLLLAACTVGVAVAWSQPEPLRKRLRIA